MIITKNLEHLAMFYMYQKEIHLIINSATDNAANINTLIIKSHRISTLCVRHNPKPFKHIERIVW